MAWIKLGNLIENLNERNTDLKVKTLLGVNLDKKFFPSIANIVGTDLSTYKIVRKGQFACKLMSVGRDGVLPLGFLEDYDEAIVSGAYYAFKVKNEDVLIPQYLMLCMSREEFDRELWFRSGGDVRGGTSWEELCSIEIPVPSLQEQKRIVDTYNTIKGRIKLKRQINDNLVALGITSLKQQIGNFDLISKSDEEIKDMEIPNNLSIKTVREFCADMKSGSTPSRTNIKYWENGSISWLKSGEVHNNITISTEESITPLALKETSTKLLPVDTVLMAMYGVTAGEVGYLAVSATTNQAICGMICNSKKEAAFLYFTLLANQEAISRQATGGAQSNLSKEFIERIKIIVPMSDVLESEIFVSILTQIKENTYEISSLLELQSLILGQLSSR